VDKGIRGCAHTENAENEHHCKSRQVVPLDEVQKDDQRSYSQCYKHGTGDIYRPLTARFLWQFPSQKRNRNQEEQGNQEEICPVQCSRYKTSNDRTKAY